MNAAKGAKMEWKLKGSQHGINAAKGYKME